MAASAPRNTKSKETASPPAAQLAGSDNENEADEGESEEQQATASSSHASKDNKGKDKKDEPQKKASVPAAGAAKPILDCPVCWEPFEHEKENKLPRLLSCAHPSAIPTSSPSHSKA